MKPGWSRLAPVGLSRPARSRRARPHPPSGRNSFVVFGDACPAIRCAMFERARRGRLELVANGDGHEAVAPHPAVVRVRQALVRAEARHASVTALLDNPRVGIVHLDRRGRVLAANDRARRIASIPSGVATTLQLTSAEAQVAVWLTEGKSVRDIAEATGQSEGGHLLAPEADLPEASPSRGRRTWCGWSCRSPSSGEVADPLTMRSILIERASLRSAVRSYSYVVLGDARRALRCACTSVPFRQVRRDTPRRLHRCRPPSSRRGSGPARDAAGFTGRTWWTTSQSARIAASRSSAQVQHIGPPHGPGVTASLRVDGQEPAPRLPCGARRRWSQG